MTTIYKYKIWCDTDSKWEYEWSETAPTTCPTNTAHTIIGAMTSVVQVRAPDVVEIKEETTPTGGNFRFEYIEISAAANTTSTTNIVFDYPINVISVQLTTTSSHNGDRMSWMVNPDAIVGATTAPSSVSAVTFSVSPTVIAYIARGYKVKITDGVNTDDLGDVLAKGTDTITVQTPATHAFAAGSYIMMTVVFVNDAKLNTPQTFNIGGSKIGSSYLPTGIPIVCKYVNNSMLAPKTLDVYLQILY